MPSLNDWTEFIEARLLQEKSVIGAEKADAQALASLDRLCAAFPHQSAFLKARAWSLSILNREEDAASSLIESIYADLSQRLSGKSDIAKDWVAELEKLKTEIATVRETKICTSTVAW
jgi:hypothetical protein